MRVAICGYGWSGSLLAHALFKEHEVVVYEKGRGIRAVCACGIPTDLFKEIVFQHGLTPDGYILWQSKELVVDVDDKRRCIPMTGVCTIDKLAFMKKLCRLTKAEFHFGETLRDYGSYDLIVDATGTRDVLGRLETDKFYTTYQVKARFKGGLPVNDFYMRFPTSEEVQTKFLWLFPLSDDTAYVGCGSLNGKKAYRIVRQFLNEYPAEILKEQAKLLRLNPPHESLPLYNGKIVGVGNSVGAITSFGEGNQLAAETVNLLVQNLRNLPEYQKQTLKRLSWLKHDYKIYDAMTRNEIIRNIIPMLKVQRVYRQRLHIKINITLMKNMRP